MFNFVKNCHTGSVLKFTDSILSSSPTKSIQQVFKITLIIFLCSTIFIWFLFKIISASLLRCFKIFSYLKKILNLLLKHFMAAALKSLADNSNIWFILVLVSVDCLSSLKS